MELPAKLSLRLTCSFIARPPGDSHTDMVYIPVPTTCLLRCFFAKCGITIGGFSSEMNEPKFKYFVYFKQIIVKKHPIWTKLGAFLSKMVC